MSTCWRCAALRPQQHAGTRRQFAAIRQDLPPRARRACRKRALSVLYAANTEEQTTTQAAGAKPRSKRGANLKAEQQRPELPTSTSYQQTVRESFTLGGVGVHTGQYAYVRVRPAMAGEGRYFVRVPEATLSHLFIIPDPRDAAPTSDATNESTADLETIDRSYQLFSAYLEDQSVTAAGTELTFQQWLEINVDEPLITAYVNELMEEEEGGPEEPTPRSPDEEVLEATLDNVSQDHEPLYTTLGQGTSRVQSVEYILAALEHCGVDNARIEIAGGSEVPVIDGSALGWCLEVQKVGTVPAPHKSGAERTNRRVQVPQQPVTVRDGDAFVMLLPETAQRITAGIDHLAVAPIVGKQWMSWAPAEDQHFRWALSGARHFFDSVQTITRHQSRGYFRGVTERCAVIGYGDRWWDPQMVRYYNDEPVRHKLTELLGDLSLLGKGGNAGMPAGHIIAYKADHSLHLRFARELQQAMAGKSTT